MIKALRRQILATFAFGFCWVSGLPSVAQSHQAVLMQLPQRPIFAAPPLPPKLGAPGQRRDAGGRPRSCKQAEKSLTALVPSYAAKDADVVWGTTVAEQPTLWFYVPYSSSSAWGEFVLEDAAQQQTITRVPLAAKPGVMLVPLADTNTSLAVGSSYRWYFNVYCGNTDELDSYVEGSITRQSPSPTWRDRLTQAQSLQQQMELFAANGVWHEALTVAAQLHCERPSDANWVRLLQAVGLTELVAEPIADCQTLKE